MKLIFRYTILLAKYKLLEMRFNNLKALVDYQFWEKRDIDDICSR